MDDRKGVKAARGKGLRVTGTLRILELATQNGLVDFEQAAKRRPALRCRGRPVTPRSRSPDR